MSQATNNENSQLRAQVERLQVELKEYRKRLSWVSSNAGTRQQNASTQAKTGILGNGSSDFQFQFPKFGDSTSNNTFGIASSQTPIPPAQRAPPRQSSAPLAHSASPATQPLSRHSIASGLQNSRQNSANNSPMNNSLTQSPPSYNQTHSNSIDSFTGLFSPSILNATSTGFFNNESNQVKGNNNNVVTRASFDNSYTAVPGLYSSSSASNTESPGSSADAHNQSSIGTSPDPIFNSPNNKLQDFGLNTINEEGNLGQWNCEFETLHVIHNH